VISGDDRLVGTVNCWRKTATDDVKWFSKPTPPVAKRKV
jgi:hypothetical protein